ncbi:MAG: OmpA family protein [Blastochloris sp.]|nr:OmpA family protein [Blastochloris sp.]
MVDPMEPKRFHLERSTLDPKLLEPETRQNSGFNPRPSQDPIELKPEQISAFSGPLKAPSIPTPRLSDPSPTPLSAGITDRPTAAFSALPLSPQGKMPQISQALVDAASTAALAETSKALQSNLAGGPDSSTSISGVPGFSEVSDLVNLRPPNALERPAFQPVLIRLSSDVLFAFDSANIKPEAEATLTQLAAALGSVQRLKITVEGHTDTIGQDAYNQRLSEQRAQAVADWLKTHSQIKPGNIDSRGFGRSRPIVNPTGSIEEQARNRRVEIRVEAEK